KVVSARSPDAHREIRMIGGGALRRSVGAEIRQPGWSSAANDRLPPRLGQVLAGLAGRWLRDLPESRRDVRHRDPARFSPWIPWLIGLRDLRDLRFEIPHRDPAGFPPLIHALRRFAGSAGSPTGVFASDSRFFFRGKKLGPESSGKYFGDRP